METSEVRRLPLSNGVKIGFVIFSGALLIAGCYMVDVTWINLAGSFALAGLLSGLSFLRHRRDPLLSDATQKTTRHHVRHRGEPVTIEMVSTPKHPRPSPRERSRALLAAGLAALSSWIALRFWPELAGYVFGQVWLLLGLLIYQFGLSVHVLLRAPRDAVRIAPPSLRDPPS